MNVTTANPMVRCSVRNAASSLSCERNVMNPPNTSPPAERSGLARPIRRSPPTSAVNSVPVESRPPPPPPPPPSAPIAAVSATRAGSTSSRGRVLPTM